MYNEKKVTERIKVFGMFAFVPLFAFAAVVILPFLLGLYMTFTNSTGTSISFDFIGFENYKVALTDSAFWSSLWKTFQYVLYTVVLTNIIAFSLALLVTSGLKSQNFFRVGFFMPNLIGGVILGYIWQFVFIRVLVFVGETFHLGIFSSSWLTDPTKALWALVIVGVWQSSGYMMLIYIAGLMGIQKSLLESAELDGANYLQKLTHVKMPLMIPAITISLFLTLKGSFMVYDSNLTLTSGGPFRATEMISMHIYNEAFHHRNFAVGQTKAIILFVIVAALAIIQVKAMKKIEVES